MKSIFDDRRNEYNVTITKAELEKAFKSEQDLHRFMHEIVANTYGEWMAEACFPLYRSEPTEYGTICYPSTAYLEEEK